MPYVPVWRRLLATLVCVGGWVLAVVPSVFLIGALQSGDQCMFGDGPCTGDARSPALLVATLAAVILTPALMGLAIAIPRKWTIALAGLSFVLLVVLLL